MGPKWDNPAVLTVKKCQELGKMCFLFKKSVLWGIYNVIILSFFAKKYEFSKLCLLFRISRKKYNRGEILVASGQFAKKI